MPRKRTLAVYWASSCGGCEIAVVNLHERLLDFDACFDLVFCPCLVDTKIDDVRRMPDGAIEVTLFNGAIRTDENEEMARLMRKKSRLLIAYGSCSYAGSIPALSNLHTKSGHIRSIYLEGPSLDNPAGILPRETASVPEGELRLPCFHERVRTLAQTVDVDYFIPGCPPESHQVWNILDLLIRNEPLPSKGSILGAGRSSVCEECKRERTDKKIKQFYRTYERIPDSESCLLDQGFLCMGPATRDGCGGLCPKVNMPCMGCYGPPEDVLDQGAKMAGTIGSILDIGKLKGASEHEINERIDQVLNSIPDFAGTFYKFSLAASLLKGLNAPAAREEK
jgi:F420-non-reducing hydrogenase small subunit